MKLQNPDKKTLREAFSQEPSVVASGSGDFGMDGLKCDGKIEVGGNISLVDFSGSLTGNCSHNVFESNGSCVNENLVKGNGYREDETQEFLVGNLVWVMTKYKKWWPGEVVDLKADAKESFMVRYIGQSHLVAWFAPSKLKPFKESFQQVLNQRNCKGFFAAVEKTMSLLSNSLKLDMTCSCIAVGNGIVSAQNVTTRKNKPLILREFSVDRLEPKEFVTQLKNIAKYVLNAGVLESTVMQCRLSAFYTFFGYKQIPVGQLHENEGRKSFTAKMNDSQFIGSPSIVAGNSRKRFRIEWFRKFVSEVDNVSARDDLVIVPPSDLISKLKLLAVVHDYSEETENIGLFEWFFSKFRISVFHDENAYKMQLANMAGFKDLMSAKYANRGTDQKTSKSKTIGKSKIEPLNGVSVADTELKTFELQKSEKVKVESLNGVSTSRSKKSGKTKINHIIGHSEFSNSAVKEPSAKYFQEKPLVEFPDEKATMGVTLSRPAATLVPDLNSGGNALGTAEFDHLQRPETLIQHNVCPQEEKTPRSMMLKFQVTAPCSTYEVSGIQFVSSQLPSVRHFTSAIQPVPHIPFPVLNDPFLNELEKLRRELKNTYEEKKSVLKSELERKMAEVGAEFQRRFQEVEAEHSTKTMEIETNKNLVRMNKLLANAFLSKCTEKKTSPSAAPRGKIQQLAQSALRNYTTPALSPAPAPLQFHIAVGEGSQGQDCLLHDNPLRSEETMTFNEQIEDSEKRNHDFGEGDVDNDTTEKRFQELNERCWHQR